MDEDNEKTAKSSLMRRWFGAGDVATAPPVEQSPPPAAPASPSAEPGAAMPAVGNALINSFNSSGGIPMVFGKLTPSGLTQIAGESATGSQQTTFAEMSQFMGLLADPFVGRGNGINGATSAMGYAADQSSAYVARSNTDAFAMFTKAPPAVPFDRRWSVWAAGPRGGGGS